MCDILHQGSSNSSQCHTLLFYPAWLGGVLHVSFGDALLVAGSSMKLEGYSCYGRCNLELKLSL